MTDESIGSFDVHSVNKILTCFELQREWKQLSRVKSLRELGYPFDDPNQAAVQTDRVLKKQPSRISVIFNIFGSSTNPSTPQSVKKVESQAQLKSTGVQSSRSDLNVDRLPLLRLLLQRVWCAFPGLNNLPIQTWLEIERLLLDFNRRNFSTSRERRQFTKRAVISIGLTKLLSSYISSVIKFDSFDSQPTRPSQTDFDLISRLPELIILLGSRIKFIERSNDQFLVIYRQRKQNPELSMHGDLNDTSSSSVKISLVDWSVLSNLIETIDPSKDYNSTKIGVPILQKLFNDESFHSEQLNQILESNQLHSSSQPDIKPEVDNFLHEERQFLSHWIHNGSRVSNAKQGYKAFLHKAVYNAGELDKLYKLIAEHEKIEAILALDPTYEFAQTWAIMWIAYMLHFIFIAGPNANEVCELLIKVDKLIPYELIKQGLKIINPSLAIKTTVALILGQPFGSLSLFQRILDSVLRHEIRSLDHQIEAIIQSHSSNRQPTVPNQQKLFEAIRKYVYLSADEKQKLRVKFDDSEEDIIILILRWSGNFDELEMKHIEGEKQLFQNSPNPNPQNLFYDLIVLLRLACLKADREQLLEMILESDNPIIRIIKQVLEIYYPTIYKVAIASDLSKKFGQTEAFLKDLVRLLVRRKEDGVSVDKLVKLLDEHKQSYWTFLNELVRCDKLCDPIKEWVRSCFDMVKYGLNTPSTSVSTERFGLKLEEISSENSIKAILQESRSLSTYNRFIKMIDDIQYRLVLSACSFTAETNFLSQGFQILGDLNQTDFARHIAQSRLDARPSLPFGWAWWINENNLCGDGVQKCNDNLGQAQNEHLVSSQLAVNSDFKELKKQSQIYSDILIKSVHLLDRPSST